MTDPTLSRRDAIKTGVVALVGASLKPDTLARLEPAASPVLAPPPATVPRSDSPARARTLLDDDWRFHLGHASDPEQDFGYGARSEFAKSGALFAPVSHADFDVSAWTQLDLPHDWLVDLPFVNDASLADYGFKPVGRAYPATSIGWYRRMLDIPADRTDRRFRLEFDGVFRDCLVSLNGHLLARNFSGYAPFSVDITPNVNHGAPNVLVVRVNATEHEGWFYEGAGIYRHVWLVETAPVHVAHWGTFVTTKLDGTAARANVVSAVENDSDADAHCRIEASAVDANGTVVSTSRSAESVVRAGRSAEIPYQLGIASPALWSVEAPHCYTLVTRVLVNGAEVDRTETVFGVRTVRFDADRGLLVNGKRVEIKGTCNHQDHAGVGAALPDRLQSYRIERLKAMGANAYRTSHNPPTAELLDACDRLGMMVLDETRMFGSDPEALSQVERLVRRDRNHPCVIAWSIANEEQNEQWNARGAGMAAAMKRVVTRLDPTRPVTAAMDGSWGKGISGVVDVQGFNYHIGAPMDDFHRAFPRQPTVGTETGSTVSTRGIYSNDTTRGYVSAYDVNAPPWASTAEAWWTAYLARPWVSGGFAWTGFDYRGEPTPYKWPCISSHFGIMDTCGFPKDNYFYYKAWWGTEPVLHLFPHWNWEGRDGDTIDVWCHTNLDRVELLLNGKAVDPGPQRVTRGGHVAWKVPYAAGTLEARGYAGDRLVLTTRRETTGAAAAIQLVPDRNRIVADGRDVAVVEVRVTDASGRTVPTAHDQVTFRLSGAGKLIGVGNGDPSSHEADHADTRSAFNGLCCAIVQAERSAGDIRLEASASGLKGAVAVIGAVGEGQPMGQPHGLPHGLPVR